MVTSTNVNLRETKSNPNFDYLIDRARNIPVEHLATQRLTLHPEGLELVGPCPKCDDSGHQKGKGRVNRFAVNTASQLFNCRGRISSVA